MIPQADHLEQYISYRRLTCGPVTEKSLRRMLARFFRDCKSLDKPEVQRWQLALLTDSPRQRPKAKFAYSYVLMLVQEAKSFIRWCIRNALLAGTNPFDETQLPRIKVEPKRKRIISELEYQKLLNSARKDSHSCYWFPAIVVAWHTGLRISDVAQLRVDALDREQEFLRLVPYKTRRRKPNPVEIPLAPEAFQVITAAIDNRGDDKTPWVLSLMAVYYQEGANLKAQFSKIVERAGLTHLSFHCLRHSFISRMINSGVDSHIVAAITGLGIEMIATYAHVSMDAKRDALRQALHKGRLVEILQKEVA